MAVAITPTIGLKKPDDTEFYDIEVPNANSDIIDAEFKRVSTQLEEKANDKASISSRRIGLDLGEPQSLPGYGLTDTSGVVGLPSGWIQARHVLLNLDPANPEYALQLLCSYPTQKLAYRMGISKAWIEIATTTPPQEFPIAFINSLTSERYKNKYWKNAMNEVTVICSYQKSGASDDIPNGTQIMSLPPTYRPSENIKKLAQVTCDSSGQVGGLLAADVVVSTNGNISVLLPIHVPYRLGGFEVTFVAGG